LAFRASGEVIFIINDLSLYGVKLLTPWADRKERSGKQYDDQKSKGTGT